MTTRVEQDSFGEIEVPQEALWGAQTQRAIQNFPLSGLTLPRAFLRALGLIKAACAEVNQAQGLLDAVRAQAIIEAALEVAQGQFDAHFPVDVFQTGSGTSTNMNANEVIARLAAARVGQAVHPNDHVNLSQSSNDVIPTAIHVSASLLIHEALLPALSRLAATIDRKAQTLPDLVKTGRTHLMDALPIRFDQELSGWSAQVRAGQTRIQASLSRLQELPQGGTAVGTGVNAPADFGLQVAARLAERTGVMFMPKPNYFEGLSSQDAAVEMSGQLKTLAVSLMKIANDLRLMNSGPLAGFNEITLPVLQPGSSIMPGKVNPVIPEALAQVCAQVIGNDLTITVAGQSGQFQLNVMLPVIAYNLLQSISLLVTAAQALADQAIAGFVVNEATVAQALAGNPMLVTALNPLIGYARAAEIAKRAYAERRSILEVACEMTDLSEARLQALLDPQRLTQGGQPDTDGS